MEDEQAGKGGKKSLPNSKTPPSTEFMKGGDLESGSFWIGEGGTKDWISRKI